MVNAHTERKTEHVSLTCMCSSLKREEWRISDEMKSRRRKTGQEEQVDGDNKTESVPSFQAWPGLKCILM